MSHVDQAWEAAMERCRTALRILTNGFPSTKAQQDEFIYALKALDFVPRPEWVAKEIHR